MISAPTRRGKRRAGTCHPHQGPLGADDRSRNSTNPHGAPPWCVHHTQGDEAMSVTKFPRSARSAGNPKQRRAVKKLAASEEIAQWAAIEIVPWEHSDE